MAVTAYVIAAAIAGSVGWMLVRASKRHWNADGEDDALREAVMRDLEDDEEKA